MQPQQSIETAEKLKLVVNDVPAKTPPNLFANKAHAERVMKDLPLNEFLQVMEEASPEELELLVHSMGGTQSKSQPSIVKRFLVHQTIVPEGNRTAANIIAWWESRRLTYNIIVGLCGIVTLIVAKLCHLAPSTTLIAGAFAYGIAANLCYTLGWMAELTARHFHGEKAKHVGTNLFSLGLLFSMMVTLIPAVIIIVVFIHYTLHSL